MKDKTLIKKRFEKSFDTYDEHAVMQKIMANRCIKALPRDYFGSIFEIGCATGILTKEIVSKLKFDKYTANDLVEKSYEYVKTIIPGANFLSGDIETLDITDNYDLIISNACLQWCNDFYGTVKNLVQKLNPSGVLAISIFGEKNLKEIKEVFGTEGNRHKCETIIENLSKYGKTDVTEEIHEFEFPTLIELLKHLKYTGANAVKPFPLTKNSLKRYEEKYVKAFPGQNGLKLTYNPVYVFLEKDN